MQFTKGPTS